MTNYYWSTLSKSNAETKVEGNVLTGLKIIQKGGYLCFDAARLNVSPKRQRR